MIIRKRNRTTQRYTRRCRLHKDGSLSCRRGWRNKRIRYADYLLLAALKGWQL